jgi:hypothetical protein
MFLCGIPTSKRYHPNNTRLILNDALDHISIAYVARWTRRQDALWRRRRGHFPFYLGGKFSSFDFELDFDQIMFE